MAPRCRHQNDFLWQNSPMNPYSHEDHDIGGSMNIGDDRGTKGRREGETRRGSHIDNRASIININEGTCDK